MRKKYSSDISCEQFKNIKPLLEGVRRKTKPREIRSPNRSNINVARTHVILGFDNHPYQKLL